MKYRDIDRVEDIPDEWKNIKLKYTCNSFSGTLAQKEVKQEGKYRVYGASGLVGYLDEYASSCQYLGIIKDGAGVGRISIYEPYTSLLGTMAYIIPNNNINIEYLRYAIMSLNLGQDINKTTIPHIYFSDYGNLYINIYNKDIQQKIAQYLDYKCGQVDGLIVNQQAQIEKLKQYKQSVITEAVTRGLNPSSPLKPSGIDWIGDIPESWKVVKNKVIFKNVSIKGYGSATVLSLYRDLGVVPKDSRDDNHNVTSLDTDSYKYVQDGDLVINKMKAWSGSLAISDYEGIVSPAYHICKVSYKYVDKRFIHHYLRNRNIVQVYEKLSSGMRVGQWDLQIDDFFNIDIGIPKSLEEQQQIADYLDNKCGEIDKLISLKQQKIDALLSYKKSLIYEYVTGKKEVV